MNRQKITIISFGIFGKEFLKDICDSVSHEFNANVIHKEGHIDLSDYYDPTRSQYDANGLIKYIDSIGFDNKIITIGLFNIDLFIPILTYIFGQAYLGGNSAIASCYRLNNVYYGLKENKQIMIERFIKEIIHELGHNFGLLHCQNPDCVMRSSTYVEDIDQKSHNLCHSCHLKLKEERPTFKI